MCLGPPRPHPSPACAQQRPSLSFAAHLVKQPGRWVYLCRPKQIKNWQNKVTYVWPIGFAKTNIWPQSTHHNNNRSDADADNITIKPLCLCCWLIYIVLLSYKTTYFPLLLRYNIPIKLYALGKLSSDVFGSHQWNFIFCHCPCSAPNHEGKVKNGRRNAFGILCSASLEELA